MNIEKLNNLIYNKICEDINHINNINEIDNLITEGVTDVLKKYLKRGLLTAGVISMLLSNNVVSAQDLTSAGVNVEQTTLTSYSDIEKALISRLERQRNKNVLADYNSLSRAEKDDVLEFIKGRINKVSDVSKHSYVIKVHNDENLHKNHKNVHRISAEATVDTIIVRTAVSTPNILEYFKNNSIELSNENDLSNVIRQMVDRFQSIDNIEIITSSNTLRNTGAIEGKTWLEVSKIRAEIIKDVITNIKDEKIINTSIKLNYNGENGDGTSGAKSPYETSEKHIKSYKERGIEEKLWKSNATEEPYKNILEYDKKNEVKIIIHGETFEENFADNYTYKDFKMLKTQKEKLWNNNITVEKQSKKKYRINQKGAIKCPIKNGGY